MPKFFVNQEQINNDRIFIMGNDVNHIKNVLRLKIGDDIEICNNDKQETFLCKIKRIKEEQIQCGIIEKIKKQVEPKVKVTIFQGLPKLDKMELIIQKSVELGVQEITPVIMKRCVVKIKDNDSEKKRQRWQKQSESAAKQCGREYIPIINEIQTIQDICLKSEDYNYILIANEKEKDFSLKMAIDQIKKDEQKDIKIGIVIGPEGGLEDSEIEMLQKSNAISITLGNRILRTETVALNILSIIMYETE